MCQNSLHGFVEQEILPDNSEIRLCNFSLIEHLLANKILSESEAIYFTLQESAQPSERFSTQDSPHSHQMDVNKIGYCIHDNVARLSVPGLPAPTITLSYYRKNLYYDQYDVEFFYNYLRGDRSRELINTGTLDMMLSLTSRGLLIKYDYERINGVINYGNANRYALLLK